VAASILSGAYPSVHGTHTRTDKFSSSIVRLPGLLQDAGFDTVAFSAMANVSVAGGFEQGFEEFMELFRDEGLMSRQRTSTTVEEGLAYLDEDSRIVLPRSEDINKHLFRWLRRNKAGKRFAFVWSIDTHAPYDPPLGFDRFVEKDHQGSVDGSRDSIRCATKRDVPRLIDLYDSEIYYNDHHIGQLIDELERLDLYDYSLIIITGDHGEAFYEHGLLSHGSAPYEELVHVPLIIKLPGSRFAGSEITALVELIDLFPTILDWTGMSEYKNQIGSIQGKSLLPLLRRERAEFHQYVYSETRSLDFQNTYLSARDQRWKYIESRLPRRSLRTVTGLVSYMIKQRMFLKILRHPLWFLKRHTPRQLEMLFDLDNDPSEQRNLLNIEVEQSNRLRQELNDWQDRNEAVTQNVKLQPYDLKEDKLIQQHLRELGYL
jgi:arylsulfatase A-like enzyme